MQALRVLLIEENADHIFLIEGVLQQQFPGTHIDCLSELTEAITQLDRHRYDVIVVSAAVQGEALIPHLSRLTQHSHGTPLIVIDDAGDEKSAANAIKHGATDYLAKSRQSLEVLPYLIHRLVKKRRHAADPKPQPPPTATTLSHLLAEIDQVTRRVHSLQELNTPDPAVAELREEVRQLRQMAHHLSDSMKSWKPRQ